MQNEILLPTAVTVRVDDVGWFEGEDGRYGNRPARSGIPRRHVPDDFRVLHEIGNVGDHEIHAEHLLVRKGKAAIHNDDIVFILDHRHILADLH